ncbi:hypothetical protein EJB05_36527, partial [Eragrostis curvula]
MALARASSPIPEGTSSYVSGKTEDADMPHAMGDDDCDKAALKERMRLWQQNYDEKWGSEELTWEEKVVEVLHIVRCREFTEYDPKKREFVLTRFCRFNIAFFDFEKESTAAFGPPLSELKRSAWRSLDASVNVISLNITESDVDFPICVFGTVLARDQLDYKCVYLFKRDRDNPQVITSPNDMLTLTGPYRGLDVTDRMFFEINLKIKCDDTGDRDFSKDVIEHNGISHTEKTMDWQVTSWLSTVEFVYAPVQYAVEATLAVTVLRGPCDFSGKVTAWTAGNRKGKVILYDSEAPGTMTKTGDFGCKEAGSVYNGREYHGLTKFEVYLFSPYHFRRRRAALPEAELNTVKTADSTSHGCLGRFALNLYKMAVYEVRRRCGLYARAQLGSRIVARPAAPADNRCSARATRRSGPATTSTSVQMALGTLLYALRFLMHCI